METVFSRPQTQDGRQRYFAGRFRVCATYNSLVSAAAAVEAAHALRSNDKGIANFLAPALREADGHLCAASATTRHGDTNLSD